MKMIKSLYFGTQKDFFKKEEDESLISVDIVDLPSVNVVQDLNEDKWKFNDNEFDKIHCYMVLEHLNDTLHTINEIYRICKNNAIVNISVPHYSHTNAYADPTHKNFFAIDTFSYFTENNDLNYYSKARFKIIKNDIEIETPRIRFIGNFLTKIFNHRKLKYFYEYYLSGFIPIHKIKVQLKVLK